MSVKSVFLHGPSHPSHPNLGAAISLLSCAYLTVDLRFSAPRRRISPQQIRSGAHSRIFPSNTRPVPWHDETRRTRLHDTLGQADGEIANLSATPSRPARMHRNAVILLWMKIIHPRISVTWSYLSTPSRLLQSRSKPGRSSAVPHEIQLGLS